MRVRLWSASTRTGLIIDEIKHASGSFVAELDGGECQLTVPLDHLLDRTDVQMDVAAVEYVHGLVEPGARTIVATDDRKRTLGEWIVDVADGTSPDGALDVSGVGWAVLPSMKSQRTGIGYNDTDQFTIARALLASAFNHENTIVTLQGGAAGVKLDLHSGVRSAYYGDLLEEMADSEDGFEWAVDSTVQWAGEVPVSVSRHVVLGRPVLDRGPAAAIFDQDGKDLPPTRRGSAVSITGGRRWSRTASTVTGVGGLDGGAGPRRTVSAPAAAVGERLSIDKIVPFPSALKNADVDSMASDELSRSMGAMQQYAATGWADRLNEWPTVGGIAWLYSNATWVFPRGIDLFVRVGRIAWSLQAGEVQTVNILGVDGSDWTNPGGLG